MPSHFTSGSSTCVRFTISVDCDWHVHTSCVSPSDPTLTWDRVAAVMDEIKDLWKVIRQLAVPEHMVDHLSEMDKKHAVGNYYVQTHPRASWEHLAMSLYYAEQYSAVEKAKQHLPKGMWRLCAQYMCGMCFVVSCNKWQYLIVCPLTWVSREPTLAN